MKVELTYFFQAAAQCPFLPRWLHNSQFQAEVPANKSLKKKVFSFIQPHEIFSTAWFKDTTNETVKLEKDEMYLYLSLSYAV